MTSKLSQNGFRNYKMLFLGSIFLDFFLSFGMWKGYEEFKGVVLFKEMRNEMVGDFLNWMKFFY